MCRFLVLCFLLLAALKGTSYSLTTIISDNFRVWDIALINGDTLAYSTADKKIKFYSIDKSTVTHQLRLPSAARKLAVNADKQLLAAGLENGAVLLYGANEKNLIKDIKTFKAPVTALKINRDKIMAASYDGNVKVIDMPGYQTVFEEAMFTDAVLDAGLSDNLLAAVGYADGVKVYKDYKHLRTIAAHSTNARAVAFSGTGRLLVSANDRGMLHIWNTKTWTLKAFTLGDTMVNHISVSPSELFVAAVDDSGALQVLDAQNKERIVKIRGNKTPAISCAFLEDEKKIAVLYLDNTVKIADWQNIEACLSSDAKTENWAAKRGAKIIVNTLEKKDGEIKASYKGVESWVQKSSVCYVTAPRAFAYLQPPKGGKRAFYVLSDSPLENFTLPPCISATEDGVKFDSGNLPFVYQFNYDYSKEHQAYLSAYSRCGAKLTFSVNGYKQEDNFLPFAGNLRAKKKSDVLYEHSELILRRAAKDEPLKTRGYLAGWYYLYDGGRIYADNVAGN